MVVYQNPPERPAHKNMTTAKENEISRLMNILEVELGEEKLNSTGQKLVDS